jgi:hypothetical protein
MGRILGLKNGAEKPDNTREKKRQVQMKTKNPDGLDLKSQTTKRVSELYKESYFYD